MGNALAALQDNLATLPDFVRSVGPTDVTSPGDVNCLCPPGLHDMENARSLISIVTHAQGKALLHPLLQERRFYPMASSVAIGLAAMSLT